jgi:signal transduction histidine kinase
VFRSLPKASFGFFAALSFVTLWATSYNEYDRNIGLEMRLGLCAAASGAFYLAKYRPVASLCALAGVSLLIGLVAPGLTSIEALLVVSIFLVSWRTSFSLVATMVIGVVGIAVMYAEKLSGLGKSVDFSILIQAVLVSGLGVGFGAQTRRLRLANEQLVALAKADRHRAVVEERRRIAGELHDVAAHLLSAVAVKSKLALRLDTLDELRVANEFAGRTASEALNSMRSLVGVLTEKGEEVPLAPQPRLDELEAIRNRMTSAGLNIEMVFPKPLPELSRQVELAIVRIVQESLTNVLRHRGPGSVWVTIVSLAHGISVVIDDNGQAPIAGADYFTGHGLVNMQERAAACGGSLTIDPSPRGGWRICAALPCGASL